VIGASGYLGKTIYKKLSEKMANVSGTCNSHNTPGLIRVNLTNPTDIQKIYLQKPDVIIWAVCDRTNELTLSQTGLQKLIQLIPETTRFVYISSKLGKGKDQPEKAIPVLRKESDYLANYFNGKILGEQIVRSHINHVIIRTAIIYGYDLDGQPDRRMKILLDCYQAGQKYPRTANLFTSVIHVCDLADAVIEAAESGFKGTINISAEKPVSYYDLNRYLAALLGINDNFITADYKPVPTYETLDNTLRKRLLKTPIRELQF
ncbi:MAG TPA: NAD-dependent epimerase/dehydratase family protein, partial [Clostridia bacterium]|nr:NAD-dependent epimerase/dehydratase family protein [Clostridia bacterium]